MVAVGIILIIVSGDKDKGDNGDEEILKETKITGKSDSLVLYFSKTGNTQKLALKISEYINADYEKIKATVPYPTEYNSHVNIIKQEQKEDSRPSYQPIMANYTNYKNIFIGYPIWIMDIPRIILSVVENEKINGKIIIPFITSNSSGEHKTTEKIKAILDKSEFLQWINIYNSDMDIYEEEIEKWLDSIGFKKEE